MMGGEYEVLELQGYRARRVPWEGQGDFYRLEPPLSAPLRIKAVPIALASLTRWMTPGVEEHHRCVEGVPRGTVIMCAVHDSEHASTLILLCAHQSFELVAPGADIPEARVLIRDLGLEDRLTRELKAHHSGGTP